MEPSSILARGESSDVVGLYKQVKKYLQPLQGLLEGKENNVNNSEIHGLAKRYVSFLAPLFKVCCNSLAKGISENGDLEQQRANELFSILNFALDCFNALRPCLVGPPYEIEIQRYWMVRRLMSWKRFSEAGDQCWITLESLRSHVFCAAKEVTASVRKKKEKEKEKPKEGVTLFGEQAEGASTGLVVLVVGLVTDLVICTGESKPRDADAFSKVVSLVEQLEPWLRVLDGSNAKKQNSMLFKGLHKCALFMATEPNYFSSQLIRVICMLALNHCACSSIKDQFIKAIHGFCYQLNSHGPHISSVVADIYKVALAIIFKDPEILALSGVHEVLDFVEYYCHHCESISRELSKDAKQFLLGIAKDIGQVSSFPLAAVLPIYAIGLGFKDIEVFGVCSSGGINNRESISEIPELSSPVENYDSVLLSDSVRIIQSIVGKDKSKTEDSVTIFMKHGNVVAQPDLDHMAHELSNCNHKLTGESLMSIFKALEFFWKISADYVQQQWASFVANCTTLGCSALCCSLEQLFHLFCKVFVAGCRCDCISIEKKKELRKSCQTVLLAATGALRLSLMRLEGVKDSFKTISDLISGSWIQIQELKWLMSSVYNIGVQMFNMKQFVLACEPLKLAYIAAWARVSLLFNGPFEERLDHASSSSLNESISEAISEACAKSVVLVDVLHRSGSPAAREVIVDSLSLWSDADAKLLRSCSPRALVKLWVKKVCADCKEMDADEASKQCLTLYRVLFDTGCSMPKRTLGILLEEELFAYSKMETQPSSFPQTMIKRIMEILLDDVYVTKEFSLERSRVLLEQSKIARLSGATGLGRCLDCLSDAVSLLSNVLEEGCDADDKLYNVARVHHQLAITYCVRAFCTQEANANSEVVCNDIRSAMKLWTSISNSEHTYSNEHQKDWFVEIAFHLLLHIAELLSLKGYTELQIEVQELIIHILGTWKKTSPEESCAMLWRESRLSHVLCSVSFSEKLLSILTEKFGVADNSLEFWENCMKGLSQPVSCFLEKLMYDEFLEVQTDSDLAKKSTSGSICTIQFLKERALTLVSDGLKTSQSTFLASELFYILSEKCSRKGQFLEALKYAKEALRIRMKVLHRTFKFLENKFSQFASINNDGSKGNSTRVEGFYLEALEAVATNVWPRFDDAEKYVECGPSQWIVLGNYIESLMQVGARYEIVGAADDAERIFQEGLKISHVQDLPLAQAAFGSCLGEIYRKRHMWELAEKQLNNAMRVFNRDDMALVCNLCKVTVEATVKMRMGDLVRKFSKVKKHAHHLEGPTSALDIYTTARQKLDVIARTCANDMSLDRKVEIQDGCTCDCHVCQEADADVNVKVRRSNRSRTNKRTPLAGNSFESEDDFSNQDVHQLCQEMSKSHLGESVDHAGKGMKGKKSVIRRGRKKSKQKRQTALDVQAISELEELSYCTECCCQSGDRKTRKHSLQEIISFNWECHRRSLNSRLLLQIGKCFVVSEEFNKAHEIFLQTISMLSFYDDRAACQNSFGTAQHCQFECLGKKTPADLFLIEHAALLYHISWISLNKKFSNLSWNRCCSLPENRASLVADWLLHAFFICSQMPALFQKVCTLLAIIHLPLSSGGLYSSPVRGDSNLSESQWAAYFHQASLGTALHQDHLAVLDAKLESCISQTNKETNVLKSKDLIERLQQALRLIPESVDDLEPFIMDFFRRLPLPTIICISLLDSQYASLLEELSVTYCSSAWIFLTRFDAKGHPAVLLLPISSTFEGTIKDDTERGNASRPYTIIDLDGDDCQVNDVTSSSDSKKWVNGPPQTVVDVVAEEFGLVLEESRLSTSNALPVSSNEDKSRWWQWRIQLDNRLANLLRKIEDSWLGPWKCLLLGEPTEVAVSESLNAHIQDLKIMLESAASGVGQEEQVPVDGGLLKSLLGGVSSLTCNEIEKGISCLLGWKGLYYLQSSGSAQPGSLDCSSKQNAKISTMNPCVCSNNCDRSQCQEIICKAAKAFLGVFQNAEAVKYAFQKMHDKEPKTATKQKKQKPKGEVSKDCSQSENFLPRNLSNDFGSSNMTYVEREPVVLVLDANSQVLPWESLPVLRKHEVYRMPSLGSISALMITRRHPASVDLFGDRNKNLSKLKNKTTHERSLRKSIRSTAAEQVSKLPVVDPYNAFYLLNPSGDLGSTQAAFEDWFKNQQGWEGKTGVVPTPEECISALQKHELFIYFGHGSGEQYLSERKLRKLDYCAAAVLMGCSSGRLSCRGDYDPVGIPLSYLMAGCPSIIANLWDVTDGDIDRFSRVLLNKWLESNCSRCSDSEVLEEFQNLTIGDQRSGRKVLRSRRKGKDDQDESVQLQLLADERVCGTSILSQSTRDTLRMGSFIGEGRRTCRLPYLIGASPVCYGVPTAIRNKRTFG